jgi:hypothetical protein
MKLRTLFALDAVVSILLALGFLLRPEITLKFFGLSSGRTEVLLAQVLGAALVGFSALAWFGRDAAEPQQLRAAMVALLSFSAIGFVVVLLGIMAQATRAGSAWLLVALFLLSAVGYGYFQFTGASE